MVSDFFATQINTAHEMMNQGMFKEAVELLKNLNIRIHDPKLLEEIKSHNNTIDKEFNIKYDAISGDALTGYGSYVALEHWKTSEYIRFYDKLSKKREEFNI